MTASWSLRWLAMEHQQFWVLPFGQSMGCIVSFIQSRCVGCLYRWKDNSYTCGPIWQISIKGVLTHFSLVSHISTNDLVAVIHNLWIHCLFRNKSKQQDRDNLLNINIRVEFTIFSLASTIITMLGDVINPYSVYWWPWEAKMLLMISQPPSKHQRLS
jgi:hypothetical protein